MRISSTRQRKWVSSTMTPSRSRKSAGAADEISGRNLAPDAVVCVHRHQAAAARRRSLQHRALHERADRVTGDDVNLLDDGGLARRSSQEIPAQRAHVRIRRAGKADRDEAGFARGLQREKNVVRAARGRDGEEHVAGDVPVREPDARKRSQTRNRCRSQSTPTSWWSAPQPATAGGRPKIATETPLPDAARRRRCRHCRREAVCRRCGARFRWSERSPLIAERSSRSCAACCSAVSERPKNPASRSSSLAGPIYPFKTANQLQDSYTARSWLFSFAATFRSFWRGGESANEMATLPGNAGPAPASLRSNRAEAPRTPWRSV